MRIPDGRHRIFERLRACALREDWDAFATAFAEATEHSCSSAEDEDSEALANKALVRRYIDMWNTGAGVMADDVLAPTYVDHGNPDVIGPAASRSLVPRFHAANPNAHVTIEAILADHQFVTLRGAFHRTQDGREVVLRGLAFFRVAGGKLAEQWNSYAKKAQRPNVPQK
jgi:predicted SnoaL-like aldol condensation-catalyzing enzyme